MTAPARGDGETAGDGLSPSRPRPSDAEETPRVRCVQLKVLELFCGIGGCSEALRQLAPERHWVVAAVDVNHHALAVYQHNFPRHRALRRSLESLAPAELERLDADLWWLSPPCQPFTRRGLRRDDEDPRARPLLASIEAIERLRPRYLALENVPGFETSRCHERLLEVLAAAGYTIRERILCPSELGWPNRRRRYYLLAARSALSAQASAPKSSARASAQLAALLEPAGAGEDGPQATATELRVDPRLAERYRHALDRVRRDDPQAVTACFTAAYGRSPVRSGSYLETHGELRRFSPAEVLRLLGFSAEYRLPPELPVTSGWRLAGNSLSIPAVREILAAIPELARELAPDEH